MKEEAPLRELPEAVDREPDSVRSVREVLALVKTATDKGEVDAVTVVTITPDNEYSIYNSTDKDRHERAGLLMEAAFKGLGFAKVPEEE